MKIPIAIKKRIFEIIKTFLSKVETDEAKRELFESEYSFIDDDEEAELVQQIMDFANVPQINPIVNKNLRFCQPSTFNSPNGLVSVRMSLQGPGGDLIDIFEDFTLHVIRLLSNDGYNEDLLEKEWRRFQEDFFEDYVELVFYTSLATCFYSSGGIVEEMISDPNVKVRYLHTDNIKDKMLYFYLKPLAGSEELSLIIEYKKLVNKNDRLETHFHDAANIFDKITFVIRTICGGSAHYDFIKPIFFGNLATNSELVQNYPSNHLFANTDTTTIGRTAPEETWISRLWEGIATRDISEWQFVNQKIRDSYSRINKNDSNYFFDKTYQLTRQLEKIVDLIQALENVIGDYGTHNAEYVATINARGDILMQAEIQAKLSSIYRLRNKYLHGRSNGADSVETVYQNDFQGRIENLETAVNILEYNLKKIIMISIINSDFKDKIFDYHRGLGRTYFDIANGRPMRDQQPVAIAFPTFNTIYY